MKARKRNTNDDWKEVEYIQLRDSYVITKADQMEFDVPVNSASTEEQHWQDVRERAAIAAMGQLIGMGRDDGYKYSPSEVANYAVVYANELIEELKKK